MPQTLLSLVLFITCTISVNTYAHNLQQPAQGKNPVIAPIFQLFDAMREHNSDKIIQQFSAEAILQRVEADGSISNTNISQFAQKVSQAQASLDEHLLAIDVQQQDTLASVWTPFAFYVNDQLSHCGSNSFQLIKRNGSWKIHYLIDVTHAGDCTEFVAKHLP
ncbi:nuclear transport factor 2 family protein [Paraglaciecola aestuariivivens]